MLSNLTPGYPTVDIFTLVNFTLGKLTVVNFTLSSSILGYFALCKVTLRNTSHVHLFTKKNIIWGNLSIIKDKYFSFMF